MQNHMASEFEAKCLRITDEIAETGDVVGVAKRGVPLVKVVPIRNRPKSMYGADKGKIRILRDIVSTIPPEWYSGPDESAKGLF